MLRTKIEDLKNCIEDAYGVEASIHISIHDTANRHLNFQNCLAISRLIAKDVGENFEFRNRDGHEWIKISSVDFDISFHLPKGGVEDERS